MKGFGIDIKDPKHYGDESDGRICGHEMTGGAEDGGRTAMETLLQKCPDINVVYTINEPAAAGAWEALKAVGKDDGSVIVTSVDGGCPGVANVKAGVIGATSQQYPLKMAAMAMEAIQKFAKSGEKPAKTPGLDFLDTGATLITDKPVPGVPSIDSAKGAALCWG
jgi:fructose transport system substrate-binding protein